MSCCPDDSLPFLKCDNTNMGTEKAESDLEFYEVGSSSSERSILVISDVWGWDSGRVRALLTISVRHWTPLL